MAEADIEAALATWTLSHVVRRNGRPLPAAHIELARRRMAEPGALLLLARAESGEGGGEDSEGGRGRESGKDSGGGADGSGAAGARVTAAVVPAAEGGDRAAAESGPVVGTILGVQGLDQDGAGPPVPGLLHISLLSVAPDRWGQHIGRLLVDQVLDSASARGFEQAQLWTHADNLRANRLYKSMGFRRSGRVRIDDWGELLVHYRRAVRH
ncbi:GNAT family N-acetyltransferase [Streptacidiphilus sp. 4-A2]|nr:GNAT family N-acetyltransferase [Streptacidiphilus sp. 4-A2]